MDQKVASLLNKGAQLAGTTTSSAAGAFIGGAIAGFPGVIVGAAAGKVCEMVIEDMAGRLLSNREQIRVGGVAALAIDEIRERLHWESPRDDGFFEETPNGQPSPGEELFEGVLLAAKQEHELKKLQYIAHFYANLVFKPYFQAPEANHLLVIVESLTYQQLCIIGLIAQKNNFPLRSMPWPEEGTIPAENLDLAQQAFYLYQRQLLLSIDPQRGRAGFVYEINHVLPIQCHLSPTGQRLVELLDLGKIPVDELMPIAHRL